MVNLIWLLMLAIGIIVSAYNGHIETVTASAMKAAELGVEVAIELIGVMSLWLGLLRLAEEAGFVRGIARIFGPLVRLLFPSLKPNSPALGAIIMNLSANVLGLGNAATPFGLKAMQELQKENSTPDVASPAMITFLALNTSCITLIPATIIGVRLKANSVNPTEIIGTTIVATGCAMTVAILVDYFIRRRSRRKR
ncbi:nucleoside recognition domain-containing protein [Desulfosporosinus sp. BICA1-9]|uniref:nucleoside recognition domain-containing protein n=1 Tax=Desulfosporosinus sp. BICA1-9 TaxID=1531958 RepID=UPI00054B7659|nr:nucleoside recognition domain-containing protein [Desulfosporosinus sp. BICA1-9]KJS47776.1 MAG: spore maturation protein [Peptococcaceae bacterium BRH_c23]KJS81744.1 MAG: spore maturation protein [Desulfosporosinus sp. BICA1-9]HBW35532.1 spore maturation protein [Desulfosporosinus sp.]